MGACGSPEQFLVPAEEKPVSPDEGEAPARPPFDDVAMVGMTEHNETFVHFRDSRAAEGRAAAAAGRDR